MSVAALEQRVFRNVFGARVQASEAEAVICAYSTGGPEGRHDIEDGARRIDAVINVDWGDDDLRSHHEKTISFCSFEHVAAWAAGRAIDHDGRNVVKAGADTEVPDGELD